MKYQYIAICAIVLLLMGCVPKEAPEEPIPPPVIQPEEPKEEEPIEEQPIIEEPQPEVEEPEEKPIEQPEVEEELIPEEEPELSEEEQIQQIFDYAKTRIKSYSYKYRDPSGPQYNIYVKGNKIRIGSLSDDNKIYIDTEKKTAEEWCISHSKCGKETGKIADLDYYDAYIETPIDWLAKITATKKIDEGFYYGRKSWKLDTNIGEVIIDSHFGFIYSIKKGDKAYSFTDASFNIVKDSDVNVPEYLVE